MERYCQKYQVAMKEPEDIGTFQRLQEKLKEEKRKAPQLLFSEIETEMTEKERFVFE